MPIIVYGINIHKCLVKKPQDITLMDWVSRDDYFNCRNLHCALSLGQTTFGGDTSALKCYLPS